CAPRARAHRRRPHRRADVRTDRTDRYHRPRRASRCTAAASSAAARIPRRRRGSELVVGGALLGILERLIRLGDFLEFLLGTGLLGDIGMVFARQPAISLLDIV